MGQGPVTIRRATAGDAAAVAEVWLRARHRGVPGIPAPVHPDDEVRAWFRQVVLSQRETWVADAGGRVVAVMVLEPGWIDQLYVDPAFQGGGIGHRLVRTAQERQPAGLDLWTFESNAGARRFYERLGFVAAERTDGHGNEEREPDVRYHWEPLAG